MPPPPGPTPMSSEALARRSLIVLAALILLFEEWIWNAMLRATARLVAHPWLQAAERRMAELEPIEALCAFVLPMLALLPFKLAAVYMLARGHFLGGAAVLALAKVVSTTLGARIYVVVRPQLQQISWYVRLESRFLDWKHRVVAALRAAPTWQALQARLAAWRVQRHGLLRQGWRRLVAVLRLMRRRRTVNPPH
ncbi:hypothetical protein MAFF301560_17360 [Ralstonia solanacearum]|nr:hypothetical protein MAFF301560_17360 [Ralstonia solanacearum]BEU46898.1 hypothetical protein MAFF211519_22230 [Ralstonia pseudosolanacearum]